MQTSDSTSSHAASDHNLQRVLHRHIQTLRFELFTRKPPHIRVGLVSEHTESAFIAERDLLPHLTIPAGVLPCPLDSLASSEGYPMRLILEMNFSNLSRSPAWVNPRHARAAYSSFATVTVVALAMRCRALGDTPWKRNIIRAYSDREHASSVLPVCSKVERTRLFSYLSRSLRKGLIIHFHKYGNEKIIS